MQAAGCLGMASCAACPCWIPSRPTLLQQSAVRNQCNDCEGTAVTEGGSGGCRTVGADAASQTAFQTNLGGEHADSWPCELLHVVAFGQGNMLVAVHGQGLTLVEGLLRG